MKIQNKKPNKQKGHGKPQNKINKNQKGISKTNGMQNHRQNDKMMMKKMKRKQRQQQQLQGQQNIDIDEQGDMEDQEDIAIENSQHQDNSPSQEQKSNIANDEEEEYVNEEVKNDDEQEEEANQDIDEEDNDKVQPENGENDIFAENQRNLQDYQQQIGNKGVVYMSRIPPFMTPNYVRKLLQQYDVERIYLLPESQWARNNRIKKGGSKRICFRQGWIEFSDKKIAKIAALSLNGQKMVQKKGTFYSDDLWNLKYLPKFKWHNLTQKLAHEERLKKQRLRLQLDQERKVQQYYSTQVQKSKTIGAIVKKKQSQGKQILNKKQRRFGQMAAIKDQNDQEQ